MDPNSDSAITANLAAIQESIARLNVLGLTADAENLLTAAADAIQARIAGIEADSSRTTAWILQQEARAFGEIIAKLARNLRSAATKGGTTDSDDAARVFGVKGMPGDPASLAMSRRDAADRVADITDPVARLRLLQSATRSGDEVLAHAIVEAAVNDGQADVVEQFMADRPTLAAATERLWNGAHTRVTTASLTIAMAVSALKPPRLMSRMDYEIERLASAVVAQ